MVRNRKVPVGKAHGLGNAAKQDSGHSSSSNSSESSDKETSVAPSTWKIVVGIILLSIIGYFAVLGYFETRVNTPFDDDKVVTESGLDVPARYWGSYRPGVYFGLKTREPKSPAFGLMWYDPSEHHKGIRHWCEQGDDLPSYGWVRHDGVNFGVQNISDPPFEIVTSFIKTPSGGRGGYWTARVDVQLQVETNRSAPINIIWYGALEDMPGGYNGKIWSEGQAIVGHTPQLGGFRIALKPHKGRLIYVSSTEANAPGMSQLKETALSMLEVRDTGSGKQISFKNDPRVEIGEKEINFVAVQVTVLAPMTLDIVYTGEESVPTLEGDEYTKALRQKEKEFDAEFEKKFGLSAKGYSEEDVSIARRALSNMVGGIGYFYGASRVRSQHTKEPVPYWRAPLYTAVPSRSFFPRGFLWDEGFHGLLIARWSPEIQLDIAAHWFELTNIEGWIPREQILGAEALARVPAEFVVQSNTDANPPMFLVQVATVLRRQPEVFAQGTPGHRTLERMYSRLQAWYQWFQTTQKGIEPSSYRWRGRVDNGLELNPKTLTSGLDDYPRASHPSEIERHVDLRCWMYAAADAMVAIGQALNRDTTKFEATRDLLGDEALLNRLHWSEQSQTYADYGLHTEGVKLTRQKGKPGEQDRIVRTVTSPPQPKLVTSAFGYISLFPMLLKVLKPTSPKLLKILEDLEKPELLWSPYGLRSLSLSSPVYMRRNTQHDPPYWRGQLWANVNYLALAALRHYGARGVPAAARLHDQLRANVVGTILKEFKRTGYLWEQYNDVTGRGSGCKPFTGWTALVVLIMSEDY